MLQIALSEKQRMQYGTSKSIIVEFRQHLGRPECAIATSIRRQLNGYEVKLSERTLDPGDCLHLQVEGFEIARVWYIKSNWSSDGTWWAHLHCEGLNPPTNEERDGA